MASPAIGSSPPSGIRPPGRPQARVGSEEYHSAALPTAQEAALLYAANHAEAAGKLVVLCQLSALASVSLSVVQVMPAPTWLARSSQKPASSE